MATAIKQIINVNIIFRNITDNVHSNVSGFLLQKNTTRFYFYSIVNRPRDRVMFHIFMLKNNDPNDRYIQVYKYTRVNMSLGKKKNKETMASKIKYNYPTLAMI